MGPITYHQYFCCKRRGTGPMRGPIDQMAVAFPLESGAIMSAITPPPRARHALPLNPAKNRRIISVAILFENPQTRVKATKSTFVKLNTAARPNISLIRANNNGPAAKPSTVNFPRVSRLVGGGYQDIHRNT